MVTHDVGHECTECGATNSYHQFTHEDTGDHVDAYCPDCGADTEHVIRGRSA